VSSDLLVQAFTMFLKLSL